MDTNNNDTFKYGVLTPFGLMPCTKDYKDFINLDRWFSHMTSLNDFLVSMFDYDGFPESIDEKFIEYYLRSNGSVAFLSPADINPDLPDELIVIRGSHTGEPANYGLGKEYLGSNDNASIGSLRAEIGKTCAVGYNNSVMSPDVDVPFYADTLKEIEKSITFNIRFARLAPILKASSSLSKEALEELLNNIDDGNMVNIITSNIVKEMLNEETNAVEPIHLTNVDDNRYIQYLTKAYEDLLRIFHTKYGQAEQGSGKLAQQSVDEVNGSASASFVMALDELKQRQKMVEWVNDMYGERFNFHGSVKFSPAWDMEYQRYINRVDATVSLEASEDKSENASEDASEDASENASEDASEKEGE